MILCQLWVLTAAQGVTWVLFLVNDTDEFWLAVVVWLVAEPYGVMSPDDKGTHLLVSLKR